MTILLDTNILLRIAETSHPRHQVVIHALETLKAGRHRLVIIPQNLYEFWTVATRTLASNGLGQRPEDVLVLLEHFCDVLRLLRDERSIYENWLTLIREHQVKGVNSYDARLVAAMQRHGISHLLTFNGADFRRYPDITVIDPATVAMPHES